jgi:hypothetical protein
MGAPLGNKNGAKAKELEYAVRKALATYEKGDIKQGQALRKIADNIVEMAVDKDKWAIEFIADRIDGKPKQSVEHSGRVLTESISEDHARMVAEGFLESLRSGAGSGSQEPDRLHSVVSSGLPSGPATS